MVRILLFLGGLSLILPEVFAGYCLSCGNSDSNDLCNDNGFEYCDFEAGHVCQTKYEWRWNDLNVEKRCQTAIGACEYYQSSSAYYCSNPVADGVSTKCYYCCNTTNCNDDPESEGSGLDPEPYCRIGEININDEYCVLVNTASDPYNTAEGWCNGYYFMEIFVPDSDFLNVELDKIMSLYGIKKIWTGLYYSESNRRLSNLNDGSTVYYNPPWGYYEPSRTGCIIYNKDKNGWDATSCGSSYPFVCVSPLRKVDAGWTSWSGWSTCSQTCDGGTRYRTRSCTNPVQAFGGSYCSGESENVVSCNTDLCAVNGNWAAWSEWTSCTTTCGGGNKTRSRTCSNPIPQNGGADCPGSSIETYSCNSQSCPIDGGWTSWTSWSTCSLSCNSGTQSRSRACVNPTPAFGGADCVGESSQTQVCNTDACPVDGGWSDWQTWSTCSQTCDSGTQSRYRLCNNPLPSNGGLPCSGVDSDSQTCILAYCPVDGGFTAWSDWSACSQTCDPGSQSRSRTCTNPAPAYGGSVCTGDTEESQDCIVVECPIDGMWSNWQTWSDCTASCSPGGTQIRYRTCDNPPPQFNGLNCVGSSFVTQMCNAQACPVDGGWSTWISWSSCSLTCGTGVTSRTRTCSNPYPANGGLSCVGSDKQTAECVDNPSCPVNGNWAQWTPWGTCSVTCGGGSQIRTRTCTDPAPQNGGSDCLGISQEAQSCGESVCPTHGGWSVWTNWGSCSITCGTGVMSRTRTCSNPYPANGGDSCAGSDTQTTSCDGGLCAVDGGLSDWSPWSECSVTCGGGSTTRSRTCTNPLPENGGQDCVGDLFESQSCSTDLCPINGNWADWKQWSSCTKSCEQGSRIRTRTCTNPAPANNGTSCAGSSFQTEACTEMVICPIDGGFSAWGSWSECSKTCGAGLNYRSRLCNNPEPAYGGEDCVVLGAYNETQACDLGACAVDGNWGEWTQWGSCSLSCGSGLRTRTRQCDNPAPAYGGGQCVGDGSQSTQCNTFGCPIDGDWSQWSSYSTCSETCGGGTQLRLRNCNSPAPENGGQLCTGASTQSQSCNMNICPDLNTAPYFNNSLYTVSIQEELPAGIFVIQLTAIDDDLGDNGLVSYSMAGNSTQFYLDGTTGLITSAARLDRELFHQYELTVYAIDKATTPQTGSTVVQILVTDINDHDPVILNEPYRGAVQEIAPVGTRVTRIRAQDDDAGINSALTYTITNGNEAGIFSISTTTGEITLTSAVDREVASSYTLTVKVSDGGSPAKFDTTQITISIVDDNDNYPVFTQTSYSFTVEEASPAGHIIGSVSATDADIGDNGDVSYIIDSILTGDGHFYLTSNGSIIMLLPPDRETVAEYSFTVQAFDNGPNPLSSYANVTIVVNDVNDNEPVFSRTKYTTSIAEGVAIDTDIVQVSATDADSGLNSQVLYSIIPANSRASQLLRINSNTGAIRTKAILDRETDPILTFSVKAVDSGTPQLSSTVSVALTVLDINDNSPIIKPEFYNAEVPYNDVSGYVITTLNAVDDDADENKQVVYSWSQATTQYKLNGNTGQVSLINGSKVTVGEVSILRARAKDKGSPQRVSTNQATIRIDVFNPDNYLMFYELELPKSAIDAQINTFLSQLTDDLSSTYPGILLRVYKTEDSSSNKKRRKRATSTMVWLYALASNKTSSPDELNTPKDFIPKDDLKFVAKDSTVVNTWPVLELGTVASRQIQDVTNAPKTPFATTSAGTAVIVIMMLVVIAVIVVVVIFVRRGQQRKMVRRMRGRHIPPHIHPGMEKTAWAQEIGPRKLKIVEDAIQIMRPTYDHHPPPNMTGWEKVMYNRNRILDSNRIHPSMGGNTLALPPAQTGTQLALPWHGMMPTPGQINDSLIEDELAMMEEEKKVGSTPNDSQVEEADLNVSESKDIADERSPQLDDFDQEIDLARVESTKNLTIPIIEEPDDDDTTPRKVINSDPDIDW